MVKYFMVFLLAFCSTPTQIKAQLLKHTYHVLNALLPHQAVNFALEDIHIHVCSCSCRGCISILLVDSQARDLERNAGAQSQGRNAGSRVCAALARPRCPEPRPHFRGSAHGTCKVRQGSEVFGSRPPRLCTSARGARGVRGREGAELPQALSKQALCSARL